MRGLTGKRIVIASGATGIGAATAKRLAEEGARLVVGDINQDGLDKTVGEINAAGGDASAIPFDLADEGSVNALIEGAAERLGGIDGLANVGAEMTRCIAESGKDLMSGDAAHWARTLQVNLTGHALTVMAAIPHMISSGGGAIVSITSAAAHLGLPDVAAYASSKVGLHALIRHVAQAWSKENIRCNGIAPGWIMTEVAEQNLKDEALRAVIENIPLARLGRPADIAAAVAFLLSDEGSWVTGQVWAINGGTAFRD